jgi:hypothetical protein
MAKPQRSGEPRWRSRNSGWDSPSVVPSMYANDRGSGWSSREGRAALLAAKLEPAGQDTSCALGDGHLRRWWERRAGLRGSVDVGVELDEQLVEVVATEGPVERLGHCHVALFERGELVTDLVDIAEVVGVGDLALDDRELDLALIQPGGVHRQVDQPNRRPFTLNAIEGALTAVAGTVVDEPEHPLRRGVGLGLHDRSTSRANGTMPVVASQRPITLARWTS